MNELLRRLLYLPAQGTELATEVDLFHYWVITITMVGATAVFVVALFFTFRYRRRSPFDPTPRVRGGPLVEGGFISLLLAIFFVIWVIGFQLYMRMQTSPQDAMDVYVTAKKWMWKFEYADGRRSNDVLVVPARRPVRLVMTSRDVIHSFFVPAFRMKQDVLPGRYTTLWFEAREPGLYRGYCAEYCGESHSRMWADVVALDAADYERWNAGAEPPSLVAAAFRSMERDRGALAGVASVPPPGAPGEEQEFRSMALRGRDVAARKGCLSCHTLDGQRHVGPSFRGLWGRNELLADGSQVLAEDGYLTRSMMDPAAQIVAGYAPVMPTYLGQLEPEEVGALLELIKSLRDPVQQPASIDYPKLVPAEGGTTQ